MQRKPDTSTTAPAAGVPRRRLIGATALLGTAAAAAATVGAPGAAHAAVVLGEQAGARTLGLTGTVVGRHRNLFRTYSPTSATAIGVLVVGSVRYLLTLNTGDGVDAVQVFLADTGALHLKASVPGKVSGNFVHDGRGVVYFTSGTALMRLSIPERTTRQFGSMPTGVTSVMDFVLDKHGRLWGGAYPAGAVVCLDPVTGRELVRTPALGTGNDYVRSLSVSPDGATLWAGTGTADPDLFRVAVDAPSRPVRVSIPGRGRNAFVLHTVARGRKVFVWHDDAAGAESVSVHDTVDGGWSTAPVPISGRSVSQPDASGSVYVNAAGTLTRMDPGKATLTAEPVAVVREKFSWHVGVAGSAVYVVTPGASSLSATRVRTDGAAPSEVSYQVVPTTVPTQSMVIDPATNTAYAGGYRGDGLCATDLATGAFAHSAPTSGIAQIEGMVVDGRTLYVGSYGSAVIVEHDLAAGVTAASSFRQLARLGESHLQSRIFAWTVAESHVVFGTVPEYGYRGGALGTIDRSTGAVTVYNRLIPELSIVGLAAAGHTVYGTTSCRAGYGIDDYDGDAVVFAADARSGKILWQRSLPGLDEAYGPALLGEKLYVGTVDSVVELRASDGAPLRTVVTGSRTARAAYNSVDLARIPGTDRLAHLAGGSLNVLEPATGRFATVLTGAGRHLSFDREGAPWVTVGNDIVKLRLDPVVATATGASAGVRGAIGAKYTADGGQAFYGAPVMAERSIPGGAYQVFSSSGRSTKILWSPGTGARAVKDYGAIGQAWKRAGFERGWGWPTTDERSVPGGVYQVFRKDDRVTKVLWSPATGAYAVKEYGAIGRAWMRAGHERGWGWPTTDEYPYGGEIRQRFSRGVTAHYRAGRTWTT